MKMPENEIQTVTVEMEHILEETAGNAQSFWEKYLGTNALSRLVAAAILLAICTVMIRLLMRLTGRILEKSKLPSTMHTFFRTLVKMVLLFIAIMLIAETLGVDTSSLLALFSIAGLAVSLSIQSALTNMTSAVMIFASKPYQTGDYVEIAGLQGTVREVGIFRTKLVTPDGKSISIPNAQAVESNITNYSSEESRRILLTFLVGYDKDAEKVKAALKKAAQDARILPKEPVFARISAYKENAIEYTLRFWVKNSEYWDVYFDVLEQVKRVFDEEGISMRCPQQIVCSDAKTIAEME